MIYKEDISIVDNDYATINIYDRHNILVAKTKIDIEDLDKIKPYSIRLHRSATTTDLKYAILITNTNRILLHRFIINLTDRHFTIDHINGDGLDNRKSNLCVCTHAINCLNRTRTRNTFFNKNNNTWGWKIMINKKSHSKTGYKSEEEAYNKCKEYRNWFLGRGNYPD